MATMDLDVTPEPRIHTLKSWPSMFANVVKGVKTFELRINDRDFHVGDCLVLQEYEPDTQRYTGEHFAVRVTYVTTCWMSKGWVAMAIIPWVETLKTPRYLTGG